MKALILATALATLSSAALAGAAREPLPQNEATVVAMADAGRLSTASLKSTLQDGSAWDGHGAGAGNGSFGPLNETIEPGQWLALLLLAGVALSRPLGRLLRRQEQQRRANALASTLRDTPHG